MRALLPLVLLGLTTGLPAAPVLQPANIGAAGAGISGEGGRAFRLAEPGLQRLVDYSQYGVATDVGTSK